MPYSTLPQEDHEERGFFRCPVDAEESEARVKIGRRKVRAAVVEKSISGMSLMFKERDAKRLTEGKSVTVTFDGTVMLAIVARVSKVDDGYVNAALVIANDVTPMPKIRSSWWPSASRQYSTSDNAAIVFGGFVLVLFCAMALPGLGSRLGTEQRIQSACSWFAGEISAMIGN